MKGWKIAVLRDFRFPKGWERFLEFDGYASLITVEMAILDFLEDREDFYRELTEGGRIER